MPNHCYQTVHIEGPRELVVVLFLHLTEQHRFCDAVSPTPFELYALTKPCVPDMLTDWYTWRVENWGTKWDVCDVEIDNAIEVFADDTQARFSFRCWTAWSPPTPIWDKLHNMGIAVVADYVDECGSFKGSYEDGLNHSWSIEDDEEIA